jgi:hypothetical protein
METGAIASIVQAVVALLLYFGIDAKAVGLFLRKNERGAVTSASPARSKIILVLIAGSLLWSGITAYRFRGLSRYDPNAPMEEVSGKTFINQEVKIDGKRFTKCRFENVTIVYDATTPVSMEFDDFIGPLKFKSDNAQVTEAWMLQLHLPGHIGIPLDRDGHPVPIAPNSKSPNTTP